MKQLIASDFDVDKMDYLLRDSIYCGVEYGKYDLRRLIDTLTLDKGLITGSYQLAIHKDGLHAMEALILARYFMFTQVYYHKIRRAYDIILTDFIGDCLEEEYGNRTYPKPDNLIEYLKWDDNLILTKASEHANEAAKNLAWRIINRHHYKLVYESYPHPDPLESKKIANLIEACQQNFKEVHFWFDPAIGHPEMFKREDLPIMDDLGHLESLVRRSAALRGLEEINYHRVYADVKEDQAVCKKVEDFCEKFMSK